MINLTAVFIANTTAVLLMGILLLSSRKALRTAIFDEKLFYTMVTLTLFQCCVETFTFCIDGASFPGARILNYLLNTCLFIANSLFAFVWTLYADYKLFENLERLKKIARFLGIPTLLVAVGSIVNLFTPLYFNISENNIYTRAGGFILPYIAVYFYLIYGVVILYAFQNKAKKYLFMPAVIFMIPIAIGSIAQFFIYGVSLLGIGVAVALVSLYINVQNEATYVDALSGLFSRQYLNNYLFSESKKLSGVSSQILAGIMLDIDRFKSINDQFGHLVGDDAIASAGKILRSCVNGNGFASRYAGDEFIVIKLIQKESEIQDMLLTIQKATESFNAYSHKPYELHFSMGYSLYENSDSMDSFLSRMDTSMYTDKRRKAK